MLTPTANFAVDPDQTVLRRAVRYGSKLFATKTSYGQTNIANPVQATPRIVVLYGSILFATKTAYGSLCQGNATYAYVNGQWLSSPHRQTLWTWIRLLLGDQFNPDPHCLLKRLDWNNLAEHKWCFAGVLMIVQHC